VPNAGLRNWSAKTGAPRCIHPCILARTSFGMQTFIISGRACISQQIHFEVASSGSSMPDELQDTSLGRMASNTVAANAARII